MNQSARAFWRLLAVGGAIAVGLTTHDAGFVVITLLGGLWLPRLLGLRGPGWKGGWAACGGHHGGRGHLEDRMAEWHRKAHDAAS